MAQKKKKGKTNKIKVLAANKLFTGGQVGFPLINETILKKRHHKEQPAWDSHMQVQELEGDSKKDSNRWHAEIS